MRKKDYKTNLPKITPRMKAINKRMTLRFWACFGDVAVAVAVEVGVYVGGAGAETATGAGLTSAGADTGAAAATGFTPRGWRAAAAWIWKDNTKRGVSIWLSIAKGKANGQDTGG